MFYEINYFIKEEAHDHRKATELVTSLQSNEIKLTGAILLRVLTLIKLSFDARRVTGDPENISRTSTEISILPLGYWSFHTKHHAHTTTTGLMRFKGLRRFIKINK